MMKTAFKFIGSIVKMALAFALARVLSRVFARFAPFILGASIPFWGNIQSAYEVFTDTLSSLNIFTNDIAFLIFATFVMTILIIKSYNIFYKQ